MYKKRGAFEFHVSRNARDCYQFDEKLFSIRGKVVFTNFHGARKFAQKINERRDIISFPEQVIKAGEINAMGLIEEIMHYVFALFREKKNTHVLEQALDWLNKKIGKDDVEHTFISFVDQFPPQIVYKEGITPQKYLDEETEGLPNRLIVIEEIILLWLTNMNPAFASFLELFDDATLEKETSYQHIITSLHDFFDTQPPFGPDDQNLMDMLRSPAIAVPHSIYGQLEYIRERWGTLLGSFLYRLLSSIDLLTEEEKMALPGPGPSIAYEYAKEELEKEHYSPDLEWMPRLVMIAKNIYVWLDQLSRKYHRPINRLDQIPDEELDNLSKWGFSGLWLIGIWERSKASQKIKQLCGNPEAVASAYALFDYEIASDLGGERAFQNLKERAWMRGIRMASDMVPNHMGIDSRWVIEHPDWFISVDYCPFPSYTFSGPDLSNDERVGIYLEDHYYTRTDAAVVFRRIDRWTGSVRYIYHGNDGTHMPWNDTAQLNYLKPEVREAVIQSIIHVARKFPVIRFDAAMTLTKRHYQRLWFPEPGTGGAIPSRSEFGITKHQFDQHMPHEFWREVVDRVAEEVPDTLLLAEAFWLMEGYFVRTLGMHRVYNSAFMNMLKNEENGKYRTVIKNTLEFDPEILKRFVNFMNNPDEETAIAQFGKEDKYFGVCTMMVTMPGLPMFGHGQIEGFAEKYGMEYRRAYWDERPDTHLIKRHEREIFPLLRKRHLFAEVKNFLLYDFFTPEGHVNENVFAYSNNAGSEKALVVYNNAFKNACGWIRTSVAYSSKTGKGKRQRLVQKNLGEGLNLKADERYFCIFRDHITGLLYIRNSKEIFETGLYVELGAYKYHVFLDFKEIKDNEFNQYRDLTAYLNGRGVPDIEEALKETFLRPVHLPFKALFNAETFREIMDNRITHSDIGINQGFLKEIEEKILSLFREAKRFINGKGDGRKITEEISNELKIILQLPVLEYRFLKPWPHEFKEAMGFLRENLTDSPYMWVTILGWLFIHPLGKIITERDFEQQGRSLIDEWLLGRIIVNGAKDIGIDETSAWEITTIIKLLTSHQRWFLIKAPENEKVYNILDALLKDREVQLFLRINRYQEILWFNKEAFERLLFWMMTVAVIKISSDPSLTVTTAMDEIGRCYNLIERLHKAVEESEFKVDKLLKVVKGE